MIKSIIVAINILAVFLFAFFQKSEVSITHDTPQALKPGEEQVVTVQIDKSSIVGFAKFQVTVDPGLSIEAIETAGASFTFNDQKAKFIWMALPAVKKFELKYRLVASPTASAPSKLENRFSYVSENERKNYDLPTHFVSFGSGVEAPVAAAPDIDKSVPFSVSGKRTITNAGINQWRVDVSIAKSGLEGFAKLEEEIPNGYTAIDLKSSNAVFSVEDNSVKYIWYDFPDKETVVVSYKLLPVMAMDGAQPSIDGAFAYLNDGKTATLKIGESYAEPTLALRDTVEALTADQPKSIIAEALEDSETIAEEIAMEESVVEETIEAPLVILPIAPKPKPSTTPIATPKADETPKQSVAPTAAPTVVPKPEPKPKPVVTPKPTPAPTPKVVPIAAAAPVDATASAKSNTDGNIVNVPQPEKGVFYRVQIAAGPNNLNRDQFAKLYFFSEDLKLETQSGLLKYTTGYHQVYKSARDARVRITEKYAKFKGPFVTAYNDGERITVQEALMVTNQKWFQ